MLMPIIIKKRAHHLFIKRPATIANPATAVVTTTITILVIPYHGIAKDNKGAMCMSAQTNGNLVKGHLAALQHM
jgi:hypothetical protein